MKLHRIKFYFLVNLLSLLHFTSFEFLNYNFFWILHTLETCVCVCGIPTATMACARQIEKKKTVDFENGMAKLNKWISNDFQAVERKFIWASLAFRTFCSQFIHVIFFVFFFGTTNEIYGLEINMYIFLAAAHKSNWLRRFNSIS